MNALCLFFAATWLTLEPGLDLAEIKAPQTSSHGDSIIRVLRIDPQHFELRLLNASASTDKKNRSAKAWVDDHKLVAAINASMFATDHSSSVALMQTKSHVNNKRLSKDNVVLAFDPLEKGLPAVQIIDRTCQDFDALRKKYASLVQNIRMVNCKRGNVWSQQKRKWSTAAVGMDTSGRVLFVHSRSPYSTHDFIDMLLGLPIDLRNAMYVEGGPEAQLYIKAGGKTISLIGSFETGFNEDDKNVDGWPIPNVIGVVRKPDTPTTE